ncbi:hypothetical protein POM88_004329 [Heracleum sosnowskyi]|uniref:Serine protease n=1 Tax=Heracleum sosnowskyi TaxID=360622 RepID=A0AAD8JI63_9APIA|nr:hypothetical protein POM88_004329 [Heracleum sosnowskyi]
MLRATVKVVIPHMGTIVGQKDEKSMVLTTAHSIPNWMYIPHMNTVLAVQFYETVDLEPCRVVKFERRTDIMLLVVDKPTPEEYTIKLASEGEWGLVESQLIGARCHPLGRHQWTFTDGEWWFRCGGSGYCIRGGGRVVDGNSDGCGGGGDIDDDGDNSMAVCICSLQSVRNLIDLCTNMLCTVYLLYVYVEYSNGKRVKVVMGTVKN